MEELKIRTLERGKATWTNYDQQGIAAGLLPLEELVNQLGKDSVRQGIIVIDGAAEFETVQRQKLEAVELEEIIVGERIAHEKYETRIQVLAYKVAGEKALLAARQYEISVQSFIMTAKEFAARVEREQIWLQKKRALMDIRKEEARLEEIQAKIMLEYLERANVEVEIARTKLKVAQENVKVVLAQLDVKEAELKVIKADLEIAMSEAEKSALIAEVAHIYADIITRGLAKVKLKVEEAEIAVGFEFIQKKLDDLLAIYGRRIDVEKLRAKFEEIIQHEVHKLTEQQMRLEDQKLTASEHEVENFFFIKDKVDGNRVIPEMRAGGRNPEDFFHLHQILENLDYKGSGQTITECEVEKRDALYDKKEELKNTQHKSERLLRNVGRWAELLTNAAHRAVSKFTRITEYEARVFSQKIHKGFFAVSIGGGPGQVIEGEVPEAALPQEGITMPECEQQPYDDPAE